MAIFTLIVELTIFLLMTNQIYENKINIGKLKEEIALMEQR